MPLDHRLLAVFSALYRVEAGAYFELLKPWLRSILHPDVVGALAGLEALDIAYEAQIDLERAIQMGSDMCMAAFDYEK